MTDVRTRFVIALLSCALLAAAVVPAASAASERSTCPVRVEGEVGTWLRRPAPATPSGDDRIVAHAVHPSDPTRHLITDGRAILRTVDDGCSWEPTFELPEERTPELAASDETDRIIDLVAHPNSPERVWAVIAVGHTVAEELNSPGFVFSPAARERRDLTGVVILRSDDGGVNWSSMSVPPVAPAAPIRLAPAPSEPDVAYLLLNGVPFVTEDGGETWLPRPTVMQSLDRLEDTPQDAGFVDLTPVPFDLAVDPGDARTVFARSQNDAYRSTDGGLTWSHLPPQITNQPRGPFVERFARHPDGPRVLYAHQRISNAPVRALHRHRQATGDLQELRVPDGERILGVPVDAAWHPDRDEVLLATFNNGQPQHHERVTLYLFDLSGPTEEDGEARFVDVDELGLSPLRGVDVDRSGAYHVHDRQELVTLRTVGSPPPNDRDGSGSEVSRCEGIDDLPQLQPAEPAPAEAATLRAPQGVQASDGEPASAEILLDLPADPRPLDVYVLLDTSNGFRGDIDDVARGMAGIVNVLAEAGVDAQFGLGGLGTADTYRYRRVVDIGPAGPELRDGLAGLCTGGSFESHLVSLHQTATGSGVPGGPRLSPEVPPGQDPTWREDSLRTVVVVTDNQFDDRTPLKGDDPGRPERQEVFEALVAADLRMIGIEVVRDVPTPTPSEGQEGTPGTLALVEAADAAGTTADTPAREDLEAIAALTGTFAPPGGVDCRDTGRAELAEGDPLVCTTSSRTRHVNTRLIEPTIGGVLERVLLAQQDLRPVALTVAAPEGIDVDVAPPVHEQVDVSVDHVGDGALPFALTVRCDPDLGGTTAPVDLVAEVAGRTVAAGDLEVSCASGAAAPPPPGGGEQPGEQPAEPPASAPAPDSTPVAAAAPATAPPAPIPVVAATPSPAPASGTAVTPTTASAPGNAAAPGQAQAPGQASTPATGQATSPGSAPSAAPTASTSASPGTVAGQAVGSGAAGGSAPAVATDPARRAPTGVATAQVGLRAAPLTFSAAPSRSPVGGIPPGVWVGLAAGSLAAAVVLGSGARRRPATARANPRR